MKKITQPGQLFVILRAQFNYLKKNILNDTKPVKA
jgi:hypothetical protein